MTNSDDTKVSLPISIPIPIDPLAPERPKTPEAAANPEAPAAKARWGWNMPCPCGSGLKYKNCCGKKSEE